MSLLHEVHNRVLDAENLIETAIIQMQGIEKFCANYTGTKSLAQTAITDLRVVKAFIGTITPKFEREINESKQTP